MFDILNLFRQIPDMPLIDYVGVSYVFAMLYVLFRRCF